MKRLSARRFAGPVVSALLFAGIVVGSACSNQGEGERCEIANGNNDCKTDEGLLCYPANQLNNSNSDRCCPAKRELSTSPVCKLQTLFDASGGTTVDSGGPVTTPPDATDGFDAASDAAEDANPVDASDQ